MKTFYLEKKYSDEHVSKLEGHFFDEKDFDIHIDYDADGYIVENGVHICLFKFRKNVIPENLCKLAIDCYEAPAKKKNYNRGASAGLLDLEKIPKNVSEVIQTEKFRGKIKINDKFSKFQVGNMSQSNIVGYFDDTKPKKGINKVPCRTTQFTRDNPIVWNNSLPVIKHIDNLFKELYYEKWENQYVACQNTDFKVENTSFSTITLNYNFQTALHKDKGDFKNGFGNLVVFRNGDWHGNNLGLYQYGVCIHIDHGDYLTFDVHQWHCNTPLVKKNDKDMRLSLVLYLRETIVKKCSREKPRKNVTVPFYERVYYDNVSNIKEMNNISKSYDKIKQDSFLSSKIIYCCLDKSIQLPLQYIMCLEKILLLDKENINYCRYVHFISATKIKTMNANYCMQEILNICKARSYKLQMIVLTKRNKLLYIDV